LEHRKSSARVVVTGMGCITPLGNDLTSTWSAALEGKSGASAITHYDTSGAEVRFACEVKGFVPEDYINKKDVRRMDRFIQLGLAASLQAIEHAQLGDDVNKDRVGVLLSSGIGGLPGIQDACTTMLEGKRLSPFFIPSTIANLLSGQVSLIKGYRGPNQCIVSACSSSAHSIGEGARMIARGEADVVIAGGSEAAICKLGIDGFAAMKALSTRNEAPEKASRPFDKGRDGFVMGEGAAVLVLESLAHAEARGKSAIAEVIGYGANADAYHLTAPTSDGSGAATCMELALKDAGLRTDQIGYVNMHGTSTQVGDIAETKGLYRVFGDHAHAMAISSTKSMTGHLLGAAGALEAIFSILVCREGKIPPTINLDDQDEACFLAYTPLRSEAREVEYALSNSFGFGGTNASLIFKAF
jgi:3-oxoacyl-[acyl-carrier-protein] synthase II